MELLLLVCLTLALVVVLFWNNYDWYMHCNRMNNEWYIRLVDLAKKIQELEERLDDDGR